jgi:hypothetical protein
MKLYRYFNYDKDKKADYVYKSLETGLFKTSKVSTFNDPFDGFPIIDSDLSNESIEFFRGLIQEKTGTNVTFEEAKQSLLSTDFSKDHFDEFSDENFRVMCLCSKDKLTPAEDILMWSHYASMHKGIRITFEIPEEPGNGRYPRLFPVIYATSRPRLSLNKLLKKNRTPNEVDDLFNISITKSSVWSYEHEYRLKNPPSEWQNIGGLDYLKFPESCIEEVSFGVRFPSNETSIFLNLKKDRYQHTKFYQMKYHGAEYALDKVEIK